MSALEGQEYLNPRLWKQINLANDRPVVVAAFTKDSSIQTSGLLWIHAEGQEAIDAIVFSAALGAALGVGISVGAAGAGTYTENRIIGSVAAYVNGTGAGGIEAG